jgi:RNA-directed DNA polymerase
MDKVYARPNLAAAFGKVRANRGSAGVDHVSIPRFEAELEAELDRLHEQVRTGQYQPQAVRRAWIPKGAGAMRPLGIPTVRDRVVQTALRHVLEPIFEHEFAEHSYGFRPGRGAKDALRRVDGLLREGYCHVVDADIKGYFDSIPKALLMERVRERVADSRVLALLTAYLNQSVMEEMQVWTPESGTPQGAVISPLLANIYLNPLDHIMASRRWEMVRYADDFVILCRTRNEAEQALAAIREWMAAAQLMLHPEKTRIADLNAAQSFDFLGYRFKHQEGKGIRRYPRPKSMRNLRDRVREKTHRCNGHSLTDIIAQINPTLRGWFEYFKHSHHTALAEIDGWVRMRLRSILRKRQKRKGRGRGTDHQRWPNQFFADHGLFCLTYAHGQFRQPPCG